MPPKLYRRAERVPLPFVSSRRLIAAEPIVHILSPPLVGCTSGFDHVASFSHQFPPTLFRHVFRACRRVVCGGRLMRCCSARRFSSERGSERGRDCWCLGELCVVYTPRVMQFLLRGGCVVFFFVCFLVVFIVFNRGVAVADGVSSRGEKKLGVKTSYVVGAEPSWQRLPPRPAVEIAGGTREGVTVATCTIDLLLFMYFFFRYRLLWRNGCAFPLDNWHLLY